MTPPRREYDSEDFQEQSLGLPYPGAPKLRVQEEDSSGSTGSASTPPSSSDVALTAARLGLPADPEQSLQPERTISTIQHLSRTIHRSNLPDAEETMDSSKFMVPHRDDMTVGSSRGTVPAFDQTREYSTDQPKPIGDTGLFDESVNDGHKRIKKATTPSGPLILREFLASGGFGEVWTGDQVSLGRTIAVKRIRDGLIQELPDPSMVAGLEDMFRAEACITASLEHPNIVPVYDIGHDDHGRPVLAMKLVRGETWRDTLRREYWETSPADFLMKHVPILVQVCQAVAFAHGIGVVHRDLKPSQVMLGDYGEVLLMDWGLAMRVDREAPPPPLPTKLKPANRRSGLSGTLAYMAPEQAVGDAGLIGPWTDTFLLGAILYELLTGGPPYKAPSSLEVLNLATAGNVEPPSVRALPRSVPKELEAITLKAMARNPADRYEEVRDFIAALQDWMTGAGRRRESVELAQKATETLSTAGRSYAFITVAISQLTNAQVLWNENPEIPGLLNRAHTQFAMAAIENDDLVLARLQAGLVEESTVRAGLLAKVELAARAARAKARQRFHLMIVVGVLIASMVGGVIYFTADQVRASQELQTSNSRMQLQMEKAALTREQAEELLTFMLEDLRPRLEPTGQIALLDGIGKQALRYFETLDWEQSTTRGLQRQVLALNQVALVQQAQNEIALALETADEAVAKANRMFQVDNSPSMAMRTAAGAAFSLRGMLRARSGQDTSATADLVQAADILAKALEAAPMDPQVRLEYAQALNRRAMMASRVGKFATANELNSQALPLVQPPSAVPLTAWPPETLHAASLILADLGAGHAQLGGLARAGSDLTLGSSYLREALRRKPDYDLWRLDLWRILDTLGTTQLERGEADSAQEAFSAALTTIEVLTSRDSSNNNFATARVTALARLAALPILLGRWSDARTMLERAQTAAEGIVARSGPQGDGRDELAMVRMELSRVMRRLNRGREALSLGQQALAHREAALRAEPGSLARASDLIRSRIAFAEAAISNGENSSAMTQADLATSMSQDLLQTVPESFDLRVLTAQAEMVRSDAHRALGEDAEADRRALIALDTIQQVQGGLGPNLSTQGLIVAIRALEITGKTGDAAPLRTALQARGVDLGWLSRP